MSKEIVIKHYSNITTTHHHALVTTQITISEGTTDCPLLPEVTHFLVDVYDGLFIPQKKGCIYTLKIPVETDVQ